MTWEIVYQNPGEESEHDNRGSKSFGEHVLHKLDKAVTVILEEHEFREFRLKISETQGRFFENVHRA